VKREEWNAKWGEMSEELAGALDETLTAERVTKLTDRLMERMYGKPPAPPPPERWDTTWGGRGPKSLATTCAVVEVLPGRPALVRVVVADRNLLLAESVELEARLAQANAWVREHGS
jgi:hypothetical protein